MPLDPELDRHYYKPLFDMFQSRGWQVFQQDLEEAIEATNTFDGCEESRDYFMRHGYLNGLRRFLAYENIIEQSYAAEQEPDEDEEVI